jgi:hypothetical protein
VKTLLKKLSSQALSCITNQPFSSDNSSSIWGTSGVNNNHLSNPLWSSTCNQPTSFFPPKPLTDLGVMRPSIETLTSVGHTTISDHPEALIDPITPTLQQNTIILTPLEIVTCVPKPTYTFQSLTSAAEQITSTPTTPVSMDQVNFDLNNAVADNVLKVIDGVSTFF